MIKALDKLVPGDIVYSISRLSNKTIETKLTVTDVIYEGQEVAEIKTSGPTIHLKKISKDGNVLFFKGTSSISDNNEKRFFFTDYSQKNKFEEVLNINYAIDTRDRAQDMKNQTVEMNNELINVLNRQIVIEKL